jgi:hypothetical protein
VDELMVMLDHDHLLIYEVVKLELNIVQQMTTLGQRPQRAVQHTRLVALLRLSQVLGRPIRGSGAQRQGFFARLVL